MHVKKLTPPIKTYRVIRSKMVIKGLTLLDIASSAGVSLPYVSMVIHGRRKSAKVRKAIAAAVGVDVVSLFGDESNPNPMNRNGKNKVTPKRRTA
ncbi:MAG: helix-turn-helix transcriptional regulator [Nitrospirae bacterium]|nr:helix-turn-helix transcriptional regulator [Nitrospirota bacterium]